MNILILPSAELSYNSGSVIYAKSLFKYLNNNGHKVYMIGSDKPKDIDLKLMHQIYIDKDILNHPIIDDREVKNSEIIYSISSLLGISSHIIEKYNIDLVHAHYASFNSLVAKIVSGIYKIPYIVSTFGRDLSIGYKCDKRFRWMIEDSLTNASKIIVPNEKILSNLININFIQKNEEQISIVPMPVDADVFKYGNRSFKVKNKKIICSINSCFSPEKGIVTLLKAYAELDIKDNYHLIIAGTDDHPDQIHMANIKQIIKDKNLEKDVTLSGFLSRGNVGNLIREADFLVDCRTHNSFSSVQIEALLNSTPIIATRTGFSTKLIEHGVNGFLFKAKDIEGLKKVICQCLSNHETLLVLTEGCNTWAKKNKANFLETDCFNKIIEIYNNVTKNFKLTTGAY